MNIQLSLTPILSIIAGVLIYGSMTDGSSVGSMTSAPKKLTKSDSSGWALWEKLAKGRSDFGRPQFLTAASHSRAGSPLPSP